MSRYLLVDSNWQLYRCWSVPDLKGLMTSRGQKTGATYGFISALLTNIRESRPTHIGMAFDSPRALLERRLISTAYKQGRTKMPDELYEQFVLVREFLDLVRIPHISVEGWEADDILATWARRVVEDDPEVAVTINSNDSDLWPCLNDQVSIRGQNPERLTLSSFHEKMNLSPDQYFEYKVLMGDVGDEVPHIAGLGDVTVKKLIREYHTIDNVMQNLDHIDPKTRKLLVDNESQIQMNRILIQLNTNLGIDAPSELISSDEIHMEVLDFFHRYELQQLSGRYAQYFKVPLDIVARTKKLDRYPDIEPRKTDEELRETLPLCGCGCNQHVTSPDRRYLLRHSDKNRVRPVASCGCGCGRETNLGAKFIKGHHEGRRGKTDSEETRAKKRVAALRQWGKTPETI